MKSARMGRRLRLAIIAAVSALALLAVAAPASQAKLVRLTGSTTLTPTAGVNAFLASQGVTVTTTGPATTGGPPPSYTFPITQGLGSTRTFNGVLAHSGGLRYTKGGKSYRDPPFRGHPLQEACVRPGAGARPQGRLHEAAQRAPPDQALRAQASGRGSPAARALRRYCRGGRVIVLGRLRNLDKDVSGNSATLSADIRLSREAARLINRRLGTNVPAGVVIGRAVSNVTVVS